MRNVILALIISLITINLEAQSFNEALKVVASDRGQAHSFGWSISIDGDYAVIGALNAGIPSNLFGQQGAAYIFKKDNNDDWQEVKKLSASDGFDMDNFGYSVDMSGDYVIVGAYQEDEDINGMNTLSASGTAYMFYKDEGGTDNWGEVKKLVASDRDENDNFGRSVGISGNYAVVGANFEQHDTNGMNSLNNAGSVYLFEKDAGGTDSWGEIKKLIASDRTTGDDFGRNILIDGDFIVVAATDQDFNASGVTAVSNAGAVYIFEKNNGGTNNWGELQKIVASWRTSNALFGSSIGMDGDYIAIGARNDGSTTNSFSGAAYVFKRNIINGIPNWNEVKKLTASDATDADNFGYTVDISGDNIIVGAFQEDEGLNGTGILNNAGSAYIFNKNEGGIDNWGETQKIIAEDRVANARFGFNVAIEGDFAMIGATGENRDSTGGNSVAGAGAAYIFEYGIFSSSHSIPNFSDLKIFPNPVQDFLNISSEKVFQITTIYNLIGQPIRQFSIQNTQAEINVSDLPKGTYILQLITENGQSVTKQIIKQ